MAVRCHYSSLIVAFTCNSGRCVRRNEPPGNLLEEAAECTNKSLELMLPENSHISPYLRRPLALETLSVVMALGGASTKGERAYYSTEADKYDMSLTTALRLAVDAIMDVGFLEPAIMGMSYQQHLSACKLAKRAVGQTKGIWTTYADKALEQAVDVAFVCYGEESDCYQQMAQLHQKLKSHLRSYKS